MYLPLHLAVEEVGGVVVEGEVSPPRQINTTGLFRMRSGSIGQVG